METTAAPSGERARQLQRELNVLIATYRAPQRLRPYHKEKIKRIKSIQQGFDGDMLRCCFCGEVGTSKDMQLHHPNHDISDNRLENLESAHQICNNVENGARRCVQLSDQNRVCARDHASGVPQHQNGSSNERSVTEESKWSSKEGEKHDSQRYVWNKWITDLENGPFKGVNTKLYPGALAFKAPWGLARYVDMDGAFGSSVTYRRFIREDIEGGILGEDVDELGKRVIFLNYRPDTEQL